ncbi:MAG: MMPL family transporter [Oscillospiraceae bacterium]|nr:MMPL family transporter [Oscillospiraceae bacterium]
MEKILSCILGRKKVILITCAVLLFLSVLLLPLVQVRQETEVCDLPNLRVMVRDVDIGQAIDYKQQLLAIDGVVDIRWLDDVTSVGSPVELLPDGVANPYYHDGNALFWLTVTDHAAVVTAARNAMPYAVFDDTAAAIMNMWSMLLLLILAAIVVLMLLILVSRSLWHPLLIIGAALVAAVIHAGTNAFFTDISVYTAAYGALLIFAVAVGYGTALLCRFKKEQTELERTDDDDDATYDVEDVMRTTVQNTLPATVVAAGVAIVAFAALQDWVMVKGVILAVLVVSCLLPVKTLLFMRFIERDNFAAPPSPDDLEYEDETDEGDVSASGESAKEDDFPKGPKLGRTIFTLRGVAIGVLLVVFIPAILAYRQVPFRHDAGGNAAIRETFGDLHTVTILVPQGRPDLELLLHNRLTRLPYVYSVRSFVGEVGATVPPEFVDASLRRQFFVDDDSRFILTVGLPVKTAVYGVTELDSIARSFFASGYIGGDLGLAREQPAIYTLNLIVIAGVLILLIPAFKGVVIPIVITVLLQLMAWISLSVSYFTGNPISQTAFLTLTTVLLGLTADFAIRYARRYLQERETFTRDRATFVAIQSTAQPMMLGAGALAVCGLILALFAPQLAVSHLGLLLLRGALIGLGAALFILPALLRLLDEPIMRLTWRKAKIYSDKDDLHYQVEYSDFGLPGGGDEDGDGWEYYYAGDDEEEDPDYEYEDVETEELKPAEEPPTTVHTSDIVPDQSVFDSIAPPSADADTSPARGSDYIHNAEEDTKS